MHPDIVTQRARRLPVCGMKLIPMSDDARAAVRPATPMTHDTGDGFEWEDLMPEINRASDSRRT